MGHTPELVTEGVLILWVARFDDHLAGDRIDLYTMYARAHGCARTFNRPADRIKAAPDF
jgi:hypothetical protein